MPSDEDPELARALDRIRERVRERTAAGDYPLGLESQFETGFSELLDREAQGGRDRSEIEALRQLLAVPPFGTTRVATTSSLPGGSLLHRVVAKVVRRQVDGVLQEMQAYRAQLERLLGDLVSARAGAMDVDRQQRRAQLERLAVLEELAASYRSIERRTARLESRAGDAEPIET